MTAFSYSWSESGSFKVDFNQCNRNPKTWKEELYAAAWEIARIAKKPLWLCVSGGIDSEIMLRSFFDQGIHFSVLTFEYGGGMNMRDVTRIRAWCREYGVNLNTILLDIDNFLSNEIDSYVEQSYCALSPFRYLQIKLMETVEQMGGYAVIGCGRQIYRVPDTDKVAAKNDVYLEFGTGSSIPLQWCQKNNTHHEPYFFMHSPELCLSYLKLPLISFALENPQVLRFPGGLRSLHLMSYQSLGHDIAPRSRETGFERHIIAIQKRNQQLMENFGNKVAIYRISIPEFEEQLSRKHWARESAT